jgi:hypothetical protein
MMMPPKSYGHIIHVFNGNWNKVENDTNKQGAQDPTQLNQGRRTPDSRSDREAHVGGNNQSQSRRGPAGNPKR